MSKSNAYRPRVPGIRYGALDELVGYAVRRAQLRITEAFDAEMGESGLTTQRFSAWVLIAENPGLKQSRLGEIMGIARSGVLAIVNALEDLGFVAKAPDPEDGRAHSLRVTARGRSELPRMIARVRAHDRKLRSGLAAGEVDTLIGLLGRLRF